MRMPSRSDSSRNRRGDVVDDLFVDELGDALDEVGLVDLVGDLGDDDGLAAAGDVFDGRTWRAS